MKKSTIFVGGSMPFRSELIDEAKASSDFTTTHSCCNVEGKHCSNDAHKGSLGSYTQAIIDRYLTWLVEQSGSLSITFTKCPACGEVRMQGTEHYNDKREVCKALIYGVNLTSYAYQEGRINRQGQRNMDKVLIDLTESIKDFGKELDKELGDSNSK